VRYINSLNLKSGIECFILIEPGLGYIIPVLQEKFKNSKIIVLHVDNSFPSMGVTELYSTETTAVENFLEKEIPDIDPSLIRIIEWRPSMNHYREAYVKLFSQVVEFIKRTDAQNRTTAAFGERWVRNFFKNLKLLNQILLYRKTDIPVIITGSGPDLEKALPVIGEVQDECLIIASSSSVMSLAHNGVQADIVITADGGAWALWHIYPYFRNIAGNTSSAAFAANLCAALPSQCEDTPFLIINDGSFWQSIILHELALPSVIVSQKGTVTASAVELALVVSGGNIYLAGVDLSVKDIRTHARPYGFDRILSDNSSRIYPVYSQSFIRSRLMSDGGSLDIYAAWFKKQLAIWPKRIFSLCGSSEVFKNVLSPESSARKNTGDYFKTVRVKGEPFSFCERGKAALLSALKDSRYAENLKVELTPLLFPDVKKTTERELEAAITEIAGNYVGESHGQHP
jgi:hypothetical protein